MSGPDGAFSSLGFYDEGFWETQVNRVGVVTARWVIQAELSGINNGWSNLTPDVRSEEPVKLAYGILGVTATDRVASTGTLTFTLNNSATNSAHLVGYYSPDHVNCRPGFNYGIRIRLAITYRPLGTFYRFLGTLDSIRPAQVCAVGISACVRALIGLTKRRGIT